MTMEAAELDARPICPFCGIGKLSTLVAIIICAYCHKAWLPYEFVGDLRAKERDEQEATDVTDV